MVTFSHWDRKDERISVTNVYRHVKFELWWILSGQCDLHTKVRAIISKGLFGWPTNWNGRSKYKAKSRYLVASAIHIKYWKIKPMTDMYDIWIQRISCSAELTLFMLGNFSCFYCLLLTFSENSFRNTFRVSNCLGPDQDRHGVGPDHVCPDRCPNCLQRISADNKSCH